MTRKSRLCTLLSLALMLTTACATTSVANDHEQEDSLESFNRAMFTFNYNLDKYILKPVAEGYRAITNQDVRNRVSSALSNIKEPISVVNQLLQGEFLQSGISASRFVINTTLGLAGTFDVASGWGLKGKEDNFERTLAKWCVKDGPYIVLPFIGPTTPRALVGMTVDGFTSPVYWLTDGTHEDGLYAYGAYIGVKTVVTREALLDLSNDLERNSVDFYTTMKSAYLQNKSDMNTCYNKDNQTTSYDFDFGIEDEFETFDAMEAEQK